MDTDNMKKNARPVKGAKNVKSQPTEGFDTMRVAFEKNEQEHKMNKTTRSDWTSKFSLMTVAQVAAVAGAGYLIWRNRARLMSAIKSSTDYVSPILEKATGTIFKGDSAKEALKTERHVN